MKSNNYTRTKQYNEMKANANFFAHLSKQYIKIINEMIKDGVFTKEQFKDYSTKLFGGNKDEK